MCARLKSIIWHLLPHNAIHLLIFRITKCSCFFPFLSLSLGFLTITCCYMHEANDECFMCDFQKTTHIEIFGGANSHMDKVCNLLAQSHTLWFCASHTLLELLKLWLRFERNEYYYEMPVKETHFRSWWISTSAFCDIYLSLTWIHRKLVRSDLQKQTK